MDKKVLENLYSPNIMFDEVTPLRPIHDNYNYEVISCTSLYKDTIKGLTQENDEPPNLVSNYINSFFSKPLY